MVESKVRAALRDLLREDHRASASTPVDPFLLLRLADEQGLCGLLLAAIERGSTAGPVEWAGPLVARLERRRQADLAHALGHLAFAARALSLLSERGIRALPLKGAALAETVYDLESDRPMDDVDLLALERWPEAIAVLVASGLEELTRADHACVLREQRSGRILELHRSITTAPGLFPLDVEGLWARRRSGRGQITVLPSPEDLLVQLALHAAFQHAFVLTLVQWLDFRRLLERERVDLQSAWMLAAAARAEPVLAAALLAADAAVGLPLAAADAARARSALPLGLRRWLNPRLASPLVFVEHPPQIARVRLLLLAGRRLELVRRTLLLPETPAGDTRLAGRLAHACARLMRLLPSPRRRASDQPLHARSCGEPESRQPAKQGADDTLGEAALRQLIASHSSVRFTVTGRCMEPAIREGEQVRLVGPERRSPRVGDVVLVRLPSGLRLHRLVWGPPFLGADRAWRIRPDRQDLLDPPFAPAALLGSVEAIEGREDSPRRVGRALVSLLAGALAGVCWRLRRLTRAGVSGDQTR